MALHILKKSFEHGSGRPTIWLISFTDVMALMLTFFVLIFSMSEPIQNAMVEDISVMQESANTQEGASDQAGQAMSADWLRENRAEGLDLTYLQSLLSDMLNTLVREEPKLSGIRLIKTDDMLYIRMPDRVLNREGVVGPLAMMLGRLSNNLAIWSPVNASRQDYVRALRRAVELQNRLQDAGYDRSILLTTFTPNVSEGLSAALHIAIMETKTVSR